MFGQDGGDTVIAGGGPDLANGGKSGDVLKGKAGRDRLKGKSGNDTPEWRQESRQLQGWIGPRHVEALPVAAATPRCQTSVNGPFGGRLRSA